MYLARSISIFFFALGLTFGPITANALAMKQAFAKPCPMENMQHKPDLPCCKDHCDGGVLNCSVKCGAPYGAAAVSQALKIFTLAAGYLFQGDSYPGPQLAYGPAPPIPIV